MRYLLLRVLVLINSFHFFQNNVFCQYQDQGIWNEFHKNNLGRIVFSSEKIIHNSPDPKLVRDTFDLRRPIKGRLYLDKSLANKCAEVEARGVYEKGVFNYAIHSNVHVQMDMNINSQTQYKIILPAIPSAIQVQEWTTWWYAFIPEGSFNWKEFPENSAEYCFGNAIENLAAGNYQIEVIFYLCCLDRSYNYKIEIAKGGFVLSFNENDKKFWSGKSQAENRSSDESNDSNNQTASEYVTFKNNCPDRMDIEYDSNGTTYTNTFINSGSQLEIRMRTGDQLRTKQGVVLYTHTYGSASSIYLCK